MTKTEQRFEPLPIADRARQFGLKLLRRGAIASGNLARFQRGMRDYLFRHPVTHYFDADTLESFFLILSMPRSGSTLLCSALSACENVIALSEPMRAVETELVFQSAPDRHNCAHPLRVANESLQTGLHFGVNEVLLPYDLADAKNRWLFHSADQVKTICLVRDPRDIWASVQQVVLDTPCLSTLVEGGIVPPQPDWLEAIREYLRWSLDGERFVVRYEDLVTNPDRELKRIAQFIGFPFKEGLWSGKLPPAIGIGDNTARSGGRISTRSVGRFREKLTPSQISQINNALQQELVDLEYTV